MRPSHRTPEPAEPAEQTFADAFRRRPARAPHGLVPGRRVWVTLGWAAAVSATVTLSAVAARGTVLDDDGKESPALAANDTSARVVADPVASASGAPASSSPSPSSSPSKEAGKPHEESRAGGSGGGGAAGAAPAGAPAAPAAGEKSGTGGSGGGGSDGGGGGAAKSDTKSEKTSGSSGSSGSSKSGGSGGSAPKKAQAPAQDFSRPLGAIVGRYGDFQNHCVQLAGSSLKLYPCDGGADQQWQFAKDGTLRKNGRCLSLAGRSTNDGTYAVMAGCDTTNVTQWRYSPGNDIVNVAADKCLDVANASTAAGTPLQIAWCSGNWAQKWNVP
ncbi:RICIN domain-containing protein [Streptomyces sp. SID11385]|uniref:RICIN domain-containing protein n=1 Tax=Streptomyces sp. SID11385 TaxID=2706031 RepID=UPI0013C933A9|nr:RICIN domain-containing protein [Streptomyces sp. SID11385]NEA41176.1 RICIN domain-containing protein [Streptomyces sp. SID11385]